MVIIRSQLADVKPDAEYGQQVTNLFWSRLDAHARRTLFVDYASRRHWTGASIKTVTTRIAHNLIKRAKLEAEFDCVTFCYHNDFLLLNALGVLFAGGSLCAGAPEDPEPEHAHMLATVRPHIVYIQRVHLDEMLKIKRLSVGGGGDGGDGGDGGEQLHSRLRLVVLMDDQPLDEEQFSELAIRAQREASIELLGFHRDLCAQPETTSQTSDHPDELKLPLQVSPQRPAFILMTSGSTGKPKPVGRSQRESLYVCESLNNAGQLWRLDETSVLAGHLQLDHGTGTFCLKQTIARGCKLIIMHGYQYSTLLEAIRTFAISDICLGSALMHNFINDINSSASNGKLFESTWLASLRNFLAVGSPIASPALANDFMQRFPQCSIRQAFGMTECGFVCIMERELCTATAAAAAAGSGGQQSGRPVGELLPNMECKLVDRVTGEELNEQQLDQQQEGELYIRGPTVSSGYLGERFAAQTSAAFQSDGFYRTNDICYITDRKLLHIRGRYSEVLCLHDGWKVLPSEIEQVILEHPLVAEAAVIGIPHPELPTCHAPRAYIVPCAGVRVAAFDPPPGLDGGVAEPEPAQANQNNNEPEVAQSKQLDKESVIRFVAERVSEPKQLVGGIRIMRSLPRVAIGKYDKKLLRKLDGYL